MKLKQKYLLWNTSWNLQGVFVVTWNKTSKKKLKTLTKTCKKIFFPSILLKMIIWNIILAKWMTFKSFHVVLKRSFARAQDTFYLRENPWEKVFSQWFYWNSCGWGFSDFNWFSIRFLFRIFHLLIITVKETSFFRDFYFISFFFVRFWRFLYLVWLEFHCCSFKR